ncbi:mannuronan synthase [Betaproteobacteria bacterium]|nr:mannuronan synthase [Betaproteobacteria bacterium]GHU03265.1 mannuronan synthase [Betaproteobacteria bacterium]GHU21773.1 mannuronan synthase [Betaproteobacteria bacterium]
MNTPQNPNLNVLHESETQRQHARIRIPAEISFDGPGGRAITLPLVDLSASGFSFNAANVLIKAGDHYPGVLIFAIDKLSLSVKVEFQVRKLGGSDGRVGCQFHNLGTREISTLRQLITAHLSGDLISAGELLTTLQRDNFTKPRRDDSAGHISPLARLRAVAVSLGVLVVGLAAFAFAGNALYQVYFISSAVSAIVVYPSVQVAIPRDGTIQSLIGEDGIVRKGAPIATFNASVLDLLKGSLQESDLAPARVTELSTTQIKGTLTSPCDCGLVRQVVADGQYAGKGDVVFELAPRDAQAGIEARFPYKKFTAVQPGTAVNFRVAGEDQWLPGHIVSNSLMDEKGLSSELRVHIRPDAPLTGAHAGRVVQVDVRRWF